MLVHLAKLYQNCFGLYRKGLHCIINCIIYEYWIVSMAAYQDAYGLSSVVESLISSWRSWPLSQVMLLLVSSGVCFALLGFH